MSPEVVSFINAIAGVYREHGFSLGHQDEHGAFIVRPLRESDIQWLAQAEEDFS